MCLFEQWQPVQEPKKMTEIIVQALEQTGQRGVINKGWGDLGTCKLLTLPPPTPPPQKKGKKEENKISKNSF